MGSQQRPVSIPPKWQPSRVTFFLQLWIAVSLIAKTDALLGPLPTKQVVPSILPDPTFVIPDVTGVTELACIDTAQRMMRVLVPVPEYIHPMGQVGISYSYWPASLPKKVGLQSALPAVVLLHGFDSSNLEFRRLGSLLAERGLDTYAVDLLGWGFTQLDGVLDFGAEAKVTALKSFLENVLPNPQSFCIVGASLGGAAAIETAVFNPKCVGLILLDAQGFVDGIGPMKALPTPLARLGVSVLQSIPLRSSANQMSYYDKSRYATKEAVTVGRLHCLREGWSEALLNFMQSGGFSPSSLVAQVTVPTLVIWGRQDNILDGEDFANRFVETLSGDTNLVWIEECGHVPHLEQPE